MSFKLINNGTNKSLKLLNINNLGGKLTLAKSSSPVTDGIVLYVDAGNISSYPQTGTTWYDLSGNGNDGTHVSGPTFDSSNGGSIVYSNNYTTFYDPPSLSITPNATISVWFKNTSTSAGWRGLVAKRVQATDATNYGINFNTLGSVQMYYNNSGFKVLGENYAGNYETDVWYNICGTFAQNGTNTDMIFYKNAVSIASSTQSGNLITNSTPLIVGATSATGEFLMGNIAVVQIYNRTLTSNEVQQNYDFYRARFGL